VSAKIFQRRCKHIASGFTSGRLANAPWPHTAEPSIRYSHADEIIPEVMQPIQKISIAMTNVLRGAKQ
jgi:hypothetical protein